MATNYGEPTIYTRDGQPPLCDPAPSTALMTVGLLRLTDRVIGPDVIDAGVDALGNPVHYLITDWDTAAKALVLVRIPA